MAWETREVRIQVAVEASGPAEAEEIARKRLSGGQYGCIEFMFWDHEQVSDGVWRLSGKAKCTDAPTKITSLD